MTSPERPADAVRARELVARARHATLATLAEEPAGFPYASLVAVAADAAGCPLLLLSRLAEHTKNLLRRPEASLLVTETGGADPLTLGRVTVLGPVTLVPEVDRAAARSTFLALHPDAATYVDFGDFAFYRLTPVSLRFVGGFGRMSWIDAAAYAVATG